ncbi:MAG: (2Fe-2S)-binding protein [Albidovulum sp.]|jgi:carbon-monoxide dehydrogenase small subunit|uniref:(2Fe-2S)-binding protein n=2 Tax=Albidovulum sp. TaxID=1872424 RepID=UPI00304C40B2
MASRRMTTLKVNGKARSVEIASNETLLETLRRLGAVEVKCGCEKGDCGACAVLLDGMAVDSCLTLTATVGDRTVTTVKGLGNSDTPHPLQTAFADRGAAQCGYCTPGMIIAAQSMLTNDTASPDESDIRLALSGNLCRCTGYTKIYDAVLDGARAMGAAEAAPAGGACSETATAPRMETVK